MELLELQNKTEELVDQLNQLKEFSDKYKQNSIQAGDAIIRSTEVLSASHETLQSLNLVVSGVNKLTEAEAEKLAMLKVEVTTSLASRLGELQARIDVLLQSLTNNFLKEQGKHQEEMKSVTHKAEASVLEFTKTVDEKLTELQTEIAQVQAHIKKQVASQQLEINTHTGERLRQVEDVLSLKSASINQMVDQATVQLTLSISEANSLFKESLRDLDEKLDADWSSLAAEMKKLKQENWRLHLFQLVLIVVLLGIVCFPYISKLMR